MQIECNRLHDKNLNFLNYVIVLVWDLVRRVPLLKRCMPSLPLSI